MSEKPIQRWYGLLRELTGTGRSYITRAVVVTYADHVAAIAAVEQRGDEGTPDMEKGASE